MSTNIKILCICTNNDIDFGYEREIYTINKNTLKINTICLSKSIENLLVLSDEEMFQLSTIYDFPIKLTDVICIQQYISDYPARYGQHLIV